MVLDRNFQCYICCDSFLGTESLRAHVDSHNIPKAFRCGFCDERFHETSVLITHVVEVHGDLPPLYNCGICKVTFTMLCLLENHVSLCKRNDVSCDNSVYNENEENLTTDTIKVSENKTTHGADFVTSSIDFYISVNKQSVEQLESPRDIQVEDLPNNETVRGSTNTSVNSEFTSTTVEGISVEMDSIMVSSSNIKEHERGAHTIFSLLNLENMPEREENSENIFSKSLKSAGVKCPTFLEKAFEPNEADTNSDRFNLKKLSPRVTVLEYMPIRDNSLLRVADTLPPGPDVKDSSQLQFVCQHISKQPHQKQTEQSECKRQQLTSHLAESRESEIVKILRQPTSNNPPDIELVHKIANRSSDFDCQTNYLSHPLEVKQPTQSPSDSQDVGSNNIKCQNTEELLNLPTEEILQLGESDTDESAECRIRFQTHNNVNELDCSSSLSLVPAHQNYISHPLEAKQPTQSLSPSQHTGTEECQNTEALLNLPSDEILQFNEANSDNFVLCKIYSQSYKNVKGRTRKRSVRKIKKTAQDSLMTAQYSLKDSKQKELPVEHCVYLDCELCGGKSTDQQALAIHKTHHFMKGKFIIRCSSCCRAFSSMTDLTSHVQQNKCIQYKCDECNQSYPTQHHFVAHKLQDHVRSGLHKCFSCSQSFDAHSDYVSHVMEHHVSTQPFQCLICGTNFKSMVLLEDHLSEIHKLLRDNQGKGKYECSQCLSTFGSRTALQVHRHFHRYREQLKENRSDINKPEMSFACYTTTHFCQICFIGFSGYIQLERHKQMHGKAPDELLCSVCGELFSSKKQLTAHLAVHDKRFLCTECGKIVSSLSLLKKHILAKHSTKTPFQCYLCKKFYSSKSTLHHHLKSHTGNKRFECRLCGKKFTHSYSLESHVTLHSAEKPFKCSFCDYRCRNKNLLFGHMKTHNISKHSICPICGRPFAQANKMKAHLVTHTGEKKFRCDLCNKTFAGKSYLNSHALLHLNEKPFSCPLCNKSFLIASNLNSHVKKVHGDKVYEHFKEQKKLKRMQKELKDWPKSD